jgi:hypothetical protein
LWYNLDFFVTFCVKAKSLLKIRWYFCRNNSTTQL